MKLTKEEVRRVVELVGFDAELVDTMTDIAWRESKGDAGARSRTPGDARGLFQMDVRWADRFIAAGIIEHRDEMFDPVKNAKCARYLEQHIGVHAWPSLLEFPAPAP